MTASQVSHSSMSLYILFSINIFSREENSSFSISSPFRISSSLFRGALGLLVLYSRISFTERNTGFSSMITQAFGRNTHFTIRKGIKCINGHVRRLPRGQLDCISTSLAVLSTTFLILIFPLSLALIMDSISELVVVP
jgi:hypothetical protein